MNLKRIIGGPLLSLTFLIFFVCIISSLQWFFTDYLKNINKKVFVGSISNSFQNTVPEIMVDTTDMVAESRFVIPDKIDTVVAIKSNANINAKSAISVESDLYNENIIIFEKNSSLQMPIASLTKLMTAIIVLDNYNLSDVLQVNKLASEQVGINQDVEFGDVMTADNFLQIMLIKSSNRSAYALSEFIGTEKFVDLMNQKAKSLNLQNTFFVDPTGISSKNVSTVKDLVKLTEYILKNYPKIAETSKIKEIYIDGFGNVVNTDTLLDEIPEVVCSKTGFTKLAKGCLLLAISNPQNDDYFINVVLGADDRFLEMKKIINWSSVECK